MAAGAEPGDGLDWNRQRSGRDSGVEGNVGGPDHWQNGQAAGGAAGGQVGACTSS